MSTFKVTNTKSSGAGSLADAVARAAAHGGPDTIVFDKTLKGKTVYLSSTLVLSQELTIKGDINGDHKADITISGDANKSGHADDGDVRLFTVNAGAVVSLNGLVLKGGYEHGVNYQGEDAASAILNNGTLTITDSSVTGNVAVGGTGPNSYVPTGYKGFDAATILSHGKLTVTNTTFSANVAMGGHGGYGNPSFGGGVAGSGGGNGGSAASAILQLGESLTLSKVTLGAGNATGGAGGTGGYGGAGDGVTPGGNGGDAGGGGYAASIIVGNAGTISDTPRAASLDTLTPGVAGAAGVAGSDGGAGTGAAGAPGHAGQSATVILQPGATGAVTLIVTNTNTNDSGAGSLRDAIARADDGTTIVFAAGLSGKTITLTSDAFTVSRDLVINGDINGDGRADVTISGNDAHRLFEISGATTDVDLVSLNLTRGLDQFGGGAIQFQGSTLDIVNSSVTDNHGTGPWNGGAIQSYGALSIVNSLFSDNSNGGAYGGAVYQSGHTLTVINSTFTANNGGVGGAIAVGQAGVAKLHDSTVVGNHANNNGGGVHAQTSGGATIDLYNSVVAGNTIGASTPNDAGSDSGAVINHSYGSFIGTATSIAVTDYPALNGAGDPLLAALADNGGPVKTMALLTGSPLLGAGDDNWLPHDIYDLDHDGNTAESIPVDAHGSGRMSGNLDIGAFEAPAGLRVTSAYDESDDGASFAEDAADGFGLSLREAIHWAHAGEHIGFAASLSGKTIALSSELVLARDVIIDGDTDGDRKADIVLSGDRNGDGVAGAADTRLVHVTSAATATLASLTLTNGYGYSGGAVAGDLGTSLNIVDTTMMGNRAHREGGALLAGGSLTIYNSLFAQNTGWYGGALSISANQTANITNTTIAYNTVDDGLGRGTAGAIFLSQDSQLYLRSSTVTGNDAFDRAGGIFVYTGAKLIALNSILSTNNAGNYDNLLFSGGVYAYNNVLGSDLSSADGYQGNLVTDSLMLGELLDNGGSVLTLSPLDGSPVIGKGSAHTSDFMGLDPFDLDRDGVVFEVNPLDGRYQPRISPDGNLDIGAVEQIVNETISGTEADNYIWGGLGKDVLDGRGGTDWATYHEKSRPIKVALNGATFADLYVNGAKEDRLRNIENLWSGSGNDNLKGDSQGNTFRGGGGKDTMDGGAGIDTADYSDALYAIAVKLNGSHAVTVKVHGKAEDSIKNFENILGSTGSDALTGDSKANFIRGWYGKDTIDGGGGNDTADYSDKDQSVKVTLNGSALASVYIGGTSASNIEDKIKNIETIIGGSGDDTITGDSHDNLIRGSLGHDSLDGGGGLHDTIDYSDANRGMLVTLSGSTWVPSQVGAGIGAPAEDHFRNFENVVAGSGNDTLNGDGGDNSLVGNGGADFLSGFGGKDTLRGGDGDDHLVVSAGDTAAGAIYDGGAGFDELRVYTLGASHLADFRTPANVTLTGIEILALYGTSGLTVKLAAAQLHDIQTINNHDSLDDSSDTLDITMGSVTTLDLYRNGAGVTGFGANDRVIVTGDSSNEHIIGGSAINSLAGGGGDDTLRGSSGDTLDGGSGSDWVDFGQIILVGVQVVLDGANPVIATYDSGSIPGPELHSIENLIGSNQDDMLIGDGNANIFRGGGGKDTLDGGSAGDLNDTADYSDKTTSVQIVLDANPAEDSAVFVDNGGLHTEDILTNIENLIGGSAGDVFTGNGFANLFIGNAGNDTLNGSDGKDTLSGGGDADTFVFNAPLLTANVDTITDFSSTQHDQIRLASALVGAGLGTSVGAAELVIVSGTSHAATNAAQRLIYNKSDGTLWYDQDGRGGAHPAQEIAIIFDRPGHHPTALHAADFAAIV